jgi:hypothetical protein
MPARYQVQGTRTGVPAVSGAWRSTLGGAPGGAALYLCCLPAHRLVCESHAVGLRGSTSCAEALLGPEAMGQLDAASEWRALDSEAAGGSSRVVGVGGCSAFSGFLYQGSSEEYASGSGSPGSGLTRPGLTIVASHGFTNPSCCVVAVLTGWHDALTGWSAPPVIACTFRRLTGSCSWKAGRSTGSLCGCWSNSRRR